MEILSRVVEAHTAMMNPAHINADHAINAAICFATAFCVLFIVDKAVARRFKRPFFVLHLVANVVISALTLGGGLRALLSPQQCVSVGPDGQPNALYMAWIYAIHIYHPLFFNTNRMDVIHHVPVYVVNTLMFSVPSVDAIHLQSLILTGVPGGLDYLLQILEGEGLLSRAAYKELCAAINTYLRAPLGTISAFACLVGVLHAGDAIGGYERCVYTLLGVHAAWNPPFFCRQAVEANVVDTVNRFGLEAGGIKLPAVRALCGKQPRDGVKAKAR
mmetsp:Transcript_46601/g.151401  ORF Transcript_46601/g.151401 Transcript_46601/m.151401 type:complete len:274 (+) Transcript_46601:252-1073(+)|eukprot:CAMPEP_0185302522 /NCGR_PEP_ID=MMETSP1363-20130426/13467_1 /TAXON_ID=38817 /ORGANISM="Gephyrocapsa oceanica, Strain RCC1303" /LENGTH=273 /DNA_ID=CAMNT_0027899603 /DNA_START=252 /DNA_END=1073 /DNA_ORIENTATION=-